MIRALVFAVAVTFAVMPGLSTQSGATEENLRITHESLFGAIKSGNLTMAQALIHPRALGFYRDSQRIVELRPDYGAAEALPSVLADIGRFSAVVYDASYRIVGDTGIVCMANSLQPKKWEKVKARSIRSTYVYINADGNWKLLSWHTSDIPLNK